MSRTIEAIIKHTGAASEQGSGGAKSQTMKAIRIHNYGAPEVLKYEDAPRPEPQAGEVLVRVHAAGVNPIDWKVREGHMKDFWPHEFPLILGWDLSGVVEEVGPATAGRFKKGDEVYSVPDASRNGAYAEYIVVRESELSFKTKVTSSRPRGGSAFGRGDRVASTVRCRPTKARPARVDSRRQRRRWTCCRAIGEVERRARVGDGVD